MAYIVILEESRSSCTLSGRQLALSEAEGKNLVAGENRTSLRFFAEFTLSDYEGLQNDTSIFIVRGWRHGAIIDWNEIYGQSELFSY